MPRYFTGVGARYDAPQLTYDQVDRIGSYLASNGYICRTGDAIGMDEVWRRSTQSSCEFYAPKGRKFPLPSAKIIVDERYVRAKQIARQYHPYFHNLSQFEAELHIRTSFQLLGDDLNDPSDFLVCWTKDGAETKTTRETGGTGQAIRVAIAHHIPVFNLRRVDAKDRLAKYLKHIDWK